MRSINVLALLLGRDCIYLEIFNPSWYTRTPLSFFAGLQDFGHKFLRRPLRALVTVTPGPLYPVPDAAEAHTHHGLDGESARCERSALHRDGTPFGFSVLTPLGRRATVREGEKKSSLGQAPPS